MGGKKPSQYKSEMKSNIYDRPPITLGSMRHRGWVVRMGNGAAPSSRRDRSRAVLHCQSKSLVAGSLALRIIPSEIEAPVAKETVELRRRIRDRMLRCAIVILGHSSGLRMVLPMMIRSKVETTGHLETSKAG
jgi:hypothetical protein